MRPGSLPGLGTGCTPPAACSNSTYYCHDCATGTCVCRNGQNGECDPDQLWHPATCECIAKGGSPIVIDVDGGGFHLTDATSGVDFDLGGTGVAHRWAWTAADSSNAWLTLDRNGNGFIEDGGELFGNFTNQPTPPEGEDKNVRETPACVG